jgi:hypothetical protein
MNRRDFLRAVAATAATPVGPASARDAPWQAGVASVDITPERSLWMAGFARRTRPVEGVALPLLAKALALQAGTDPPAILGVARVEQQAGPSDVVPLLHLLRDAIGDVRRHAKQIDGDEAVWMGQTMLLGPRQDIEDSAEAVRKVQLHSAQLARDTSA